MEGKNMSEKEFQELQKRLASELGATEPTEDDEVIEEMLRHENGAVRPAVRLRNAAPLNVEFIQEPQEEKPQAQPEKEQPEEPAAPVTRGKYEKVTEDGAAASAALSAPKADALLRKPGKYEKITEEQEGYFNPDVPKETASERRKRAKRNAQITRIVIGLAAVFVIGLGAGLIVNTLQSKDNDVTPGGENQPAMSVQTGTDAEGNTVTIPAEDPADEVECNILGINPLESFVAVLEGGTHPLQVSMTTKGTASAGDLQWESSDTAVAEITMDGIIQAVGAGECTITVSAKDDPSVSAEVRCVVRHMEERDGVTYVDDILLLNKTYGVDESYNPGGLTAETQAAFDELRADAMEEGLDIYISSGFRSYYDQDIIYNNYTEIYGWEVSDTFSARPGHSEHQSGLAIDVNTIDDAFADTPEAAWLKEHCADYGFIIRYAADKVDITGYKYEPWHIRYVGKEIAAELTELGISLEEYLGVDSVYAEDWQG
ncbi:MAG: D-alanyl-D-alanine carboxypeptidase family protein [Ruminococcus sp.]|nr:D-alanyl-D-alanine carboxypeptidase family protein [Ruminococcus sp.]